MASRTPHDDSSSKSYTGSSVAVLIVVAVLAATGIFIVKSSLAGGASPATAPQDEEGPDAKAADGDKEKTEKKAAVDKDGKPVENPFPNKFPAPELDGGTAWLNTAGEITKKDLRGKIVLLDFWTYCCINCMHVLPDLHFLEKKYPNEIVVIGVHSAKFDNEKDSEAIRRAIVRYEIEHPVINDSNMTLWRKFGARAWPTLVMLDPEGDYCGYVSGEGNRELLDDVIKRMIAYHEAKGTLDRTPVQFALERDKIKPGPLKFPGKLLADEAGDRLFISDSNHNRIVIASADGKLLDVIGNGSIGAKDGSYAEASFDHPQGMALAGDTLYVADTENHLLRTVDLKKKTVSTLAGTGKQARMRVRSGELKRTALNSPWDVTVVGDTLFVAMAGPHQIWAHVIGSQTIGVFAGSGREDIINGPHEESALAQPSDISSDGKFLYVADSEGSAIRQISIDPRGTVTTLVGTHDLPDARSLFAFGDTDGVGTEARLQHPLASHYHDGRVFVADSYNHKIKIVDVEKREATTWLGTGEFGPGLDPLQLDEPAGVAVFGKTLFIADTNNHRIVQVDLDEKNPNPRVFAIAGLEPPKPVAAKDVDEGPTPVGTELEPQKLAVGKPLKLQVTLRYPADFKLNKEAPVRAKVTAGDPNLVAADSQGIRFRGTVEGDVATFEIPLQGKPGRTVLKLAVSYGYCRGGTGGLCKLNTARWSLPVEFVADGSDLVTLRTDIPK